MNKTAETAQRYCFIFIQPCKDFDALLRTSHQNPYDEDDNQVIKTLSRQQESLSERLKIMSFK